MRKQNIFRAIAFAAGIFLLEGSSSLVHALVLHDIPADLVAQVVLAWSYFIGGSVLAAYLATRRRRHYA